MSAHDHKILKERVKEKMKNLIKPAWLDEVNLTIKNGSNFNQDEGSTQRKLIFPKVSSKGRNPESFFSLLKYLPAGVNYKLCGFRAAGVGVLGIVYIIRRNVGERNLFQIFISYSEYQTFGSVR